MLGRREVREQGEEGRRWMDEERGGKVRMSNGEGWDGRKEGTVMEL